MTGAEINGLNERFLFGAMILEEHLDEAIMKDNYFKGCPYDNYAFNKAVVNINEVFLHNIDIRENDLITVNLFSGEKCTVKVERVETDINGVTSVRGGVVDENDDWGYFYLTNNCNSKCTTCRVRL